MSKVVGYVRVSSAEQRDEGCSLAAQERRIGAWAEFSGYEQVEMFTDAGLSGCRADNRPGLQSAIQAIGKGDVLVVYSLSRLARSTKDTLEIAERLIRVGADLVSLSEKIDTISAAGKMIFRVLASLAEFERDQISERTKMALDYQKTQGKLLGQAPYGYRRDGNAFIVDAGEGAIVELVYEYRTQNWNYSRIAKHLNDNGYRTRSGGAFYSQTIKNIVAKKAA